MQDTKRTRYTIQVKGLILAHVDGSLPQARGKAARQAAFYKVEVEIYAQTAAGPVWVEGVLPNGSTTHPVSL